MKTDLESQTVIPGKRLKRLNAIGKGTLMVGSMILVIVLSLQFTNDLLFSRDSIGARTNTDFQNKKKDIHLLFMGASDMKTAMIPKVFDMPAFNYAMHNEFYIGTYYKLKNCIDTMPALERIILPVSLGSFLSYWSLRTDVSSFVFIDSDDFRELLDEQGIIPCFQKLRRYCHVMKPNRFREFLLNLGNLMAGNPIVNAELMDGYLKHTGSEFEPERAAAKARLYFSASEPFDATMVSYFHKILWLCHSRKIAVITVTLPKALPYLETAKQFVTMDQVETRILSHPDVRPYIQEHFNFLELFSDHQELFYDANHLNYNGAMRLSEAIASRLRPGIAGPR